MAISSTGLLANSKRTTHRYRNRQEKLELTAVATPATFNLRPYSNIFNPFSYGCSVFCNHPANDSVKNILKNVKTGWFIEGKGISCEIPLDQYNTYPKNGGGAQNFAEESPEGVTIRDPRIDSGVTTPAATVATSIRTNASRIPRRCVTPDPSPHTKPKLVVDLRKSHSQESIYWTPIPNVSEADHSETLDSSKSCTSKSKQTAAKTSQKSIENKAPPPVTPPPAPVPILTHQDTLTPVQEEDMDIEVYRRRGKKKKRITTAVYQESQEPETQVAAMGSDSRIPSSGENTPPAPKSGEISAPGLSRCESYVGASAAGVYNDVWPSWCNLDGSQLSRLARQLDRETVEAEFCDYRRNALEETLKAVHSLRKDSSVLRSKAILCTQLELGMNQRPQEESTGWLTLPRTYSRAVSRFELPMDRRLLGKMTPMEYLSKFVVVCESRLQMYNKVFVLYNKQEQTFETADQNGVIIKPRLMLGKDMPEAIAVALGSVYDEEKSNFVKELLDWKDDNIITFRLWAGVCAVCERIIGILDNEDVDPRDEIERADFESLPRMLNGIKPNAKLMKLLFLIKDN